MGNGGFYVCLSEPHFVSGWWKETAQTRDVQRSERRRREPLERSGGLFLQKVLKSGLGNAIFSILHEIFHQKNKSEASIKSHVFSVLII